jgi:cell division protein FtsQ
LRRALPLPATAAALPVDIRFMNALSAALGLVFVLLLLVLGLSWLVRQPLFNLSAISVQGDVVHNNAVTLRANVAPRLAGNFFTVNLAQTRAVFESVPWVRKATVQRQFPDRLKVVLQEHQAVAYWGSEGDTRLINSFGEVFEANQAEVEAADLPQLNGPLGQAPLVLAAYRSVSAQFDKLDMQVERMELTGQGSWRAWFENGAAIEMGHGSLSDIESRVQRFIATLSQVPSRYGRNLESADLRYSNGYALKLKGVTTLNPGDTDDKKVKR